MSGGRSWGRRGRGDSRAGERSGLGLLDVVDDGGAHGHGDAAGTMTDAVITVARARQRRPWCGRVRERSWGGEGVSASLGEEWVGDRPRAAERRGEEAGRRAATWCALVPTSSTWLPAWPSQAARWSGGWAGPEGGLARWVPGKPILCFVFLFLFFCKFVALLKIARHF